MDDRLVQGAGIIARDQAEQVAHQVIMVLGEPVDCLVDFLKYLSARLLRLSDGMDTAHDIARTLHAALVDWYKYRTVKHVTGREFLACIRALPRIADFLFPDATCAKCVREIETELDRLVEFAHLVQLALHPSPTTSSSS